MDYVDHVQPRTDIKEKIKQLSQEPFVDDRTIIGGLLYGKPTWPEIPTIMHRTRVENRCAPSSVDSSASPS